MSEEKSVEVQFVLCACGKTFTPKEHKEHYCPGQQKLYTIDQIIEMLPPEEDMSNISMFIGKVPPLIRNGEYEIVVGRNQFRSEFIEKLKCIQTSKH